MGSIHNNFILWRGRKDLDRAPAPLVIGATGGSGTRVFVRIARHAGFFMGKHLNRSDDSLDSVGFLKKWVPIRLRTESLPATRDADDDMRVMLIKHRRGIPSPTAPWGIKNPRFIFLLDYLHAQFPEMKFLHVIRDGRDMAFSKNQNQLRDYGDLCLDSTLASAPVPVRAMALWAKINLQAARYGEEHMGSAYRRICYEDLCGDPRRVIQKIFEFIGTQPKDREGVLAVVKPSSSIGRWRTQDPTLLTELLHVGEPALQKFGYGV